MFFLITRSRTQGTGRLSLNFGCVMKIERGRESGHGHRAAAGGHGRLKRRNAARRHTQASRFTSIIDVCTSGQMEENQLLSFCLHLHTDADYYAQTQTEHKQLATQLVRCKLDNSDCIKCKSKILLSREEITTYKHDTNLIQKCMFVHICLHKHAHTNTYTYCFHIFVCRVEEVFISS